MRFPNRIEALDCSWLTRVLSRHGLPPCTRISRFTVEPIDSGYTAKLCRILLEFDAEPGSAPRSLVAKFHSDSASIRATFEALHIYAKEVRFYQFVESGTGLPIPTCYAAEYDNASGDFVLLLEDLSAARPGSWEEALDDVRTAIPQLAKIHARYWNDLQLVQADWTVKPFADEISQLNRADWKRYLDKVKAEYRDQWPEAVWQHCDQVYEHWDALMRFMDGESYSLVHTDAHLGQMFFPSTDLPRFVLFDWQYPSKALAAEDLCHLMVNELGPDERREHEQALIDLYYQSLLHEGVTDFSRERLWLHCRLGLIWLILMYLRTMAVPDLLQTLKDEAEAAGERWQAWVFDQLGPAITDWNLAEAIDQAVAEAVAVQQPRRY